MLKTTILKQKKEKEQLLSHPYIKREKTKEAQKWLDSDLIKVVLGPRRAGKSVFSFMLLKERPFAYFNFEEELLDDKLNLDTLIQELKIAYGDTTTLLFDEIQNLPKWELFVNRLHRQGYNLLLTGSNAKLLSKELATVLTGRHIPLEIFPFNFNEFLLAKNIHVDEETLGLPEEKAKLLRSVEQYLHSGGYPQVAVNNLDSRGYIDVLFDSLLYKDVVKRHNIRSSQQIDALGIYLINNVSAEYTVRHLVRALEARSGVTLEKYLNYFIEAYLLFSLGRYSTKAHERIRFPRKAYVVDNSYVDAKAVQYSPNNGRLMENLVFMELVKRGAQPDRDLFYYKTRNQREVDFVLRKGIQTIELIQVTYDMSDERVRNREIKALFEAAEELHPEKLTILSWDEEKTIKKNDVEIHVVPLWKWLTSSR